jgi:bacterioferritin (cytochrome b1)
MEPDVTLIDALNELWTVKRALIDQNVARSKVCAARGHEPFADGFSRIAFGHMREVASLLDRVVELGAMPELQTVPAVPIGQTLAEQVRLSLQAERATTELYRRTLEVCDKVGDDRTWHLVADALEAQTGNLLWLEAHAATRGDRDRR